MEGRPWLWNRTLSISNNREINFAICWNTR
jgi:hypothetical protein